MAIIFKNHPISEKYPKAHGFFQKWLEIQPPILLTFLIHIDVLILCKKFELIPTSILRVTAILRKRQNIEKYPVL